MPSTIHVRNWEKFQHYKDRQPPWIKLYNQLLTDYEFSCLQDASKAHLIGIWLLASQMNNVMPNDPKWIAQRINATGKIDLKPLIDGGFLRVEHDASETLADCKQNACLETETETETETDSMSSKGSTAVERVFDHWKSQYGHPKAVLTPKRRKLIRAALRDYELDDVLQSISGYQHSPHHMGENSRNTVYDSIELFLRDAKHIEMGLGFYREPAEKAGQRDKHREDIQIMANLLRIERSDDESWDDFEARVTAANERRIAANA